MTRNISDLIIHPIRMRILSLVQRHDVMTAAELHSQLPEITQRTLYRHLEDLREGGVLEVAESRRVRGTLEQHYRLCRPLLLTEEERRNASAEDWQRFFAYVTSLLSVEFAAFVRARHGPGGLQPASYIRVGEIKATPEQVALLVEDTITRANATTAEPNSSSYRIGLMIFPLDTTVIEENPSL